MCQLLEVSKSRYYRWLKNPVSVTKAENLAIKKVIEEVHIKSRQNYGSPRIKSELEKKGLKYNQKRIAKIMRDNNIKSKLKRSYKSTTDSKHNHPVAENILNRDFNAAKPDQKWVSDVTYVATMAGWLYLCTVIDLHSRKVVGWSMSENIKSDLVIAAFDMAVNDRKPANGLIFHSDQGKQYACNEFRKKLKNWGCTQSMSRKGNCWDNAVAESFFHTLKGEELSFHNFRTREEAKSCIFEYIEVFYNRQRSHSAIGYLSPQQFEEVVP